MGSLGSLGLIDLIISSARTTTTHRKNCDQLAEHVKLIANLSDKLKSTDLVNLPATKEPLDGLDEALNKALRLVECCRDKSFLYLIAMGWTIVYQFHQIQAEIDQYLKLVPLISLVHEFRTQNEELTQDLEEGLLEIEQDKREYSLDEEDIEAQSVILKTDRTKKDANILEKSVSRRYPQLGFQEALQQEKEKLHVELQRSRTLSDSKQCQVIEHLIDVTQNVVNVIPENKVNKLLVNEPTQLIAGYVSNANSGCGQIELQPREQCRSQWQVDLFDCCSEPCLSLKTCIYPCGVFSSITNVVSKGKICREKAISDLLTYSLFCGCCCYSCCVRNKLREVLNIEGGICDDYLTHLMCCCCAMVQEWREIESRGFDGYEGRKMVPPPYQYMKP